MINEDLNEVHTWLQAKKLALNVTKTKYMLMDTPKYFRHSQRTH